MPLQACAQRIVYELSAAGPLTAAHLAARVGISRQVVVKHLLALADEGLATGERIGRETRYELDTRQVAEAETWLRTIGANWEQRLQALKALLEHDAGEVESSTASVSIFDARVRGVPIDAGRRLSEEPRSVSGCGGNIVGTPAAWIPRPFGKT